MSEPYTFKLVDPSLHSEAVGPPYKGTNADCLRDGLLDVIHIALDSGMALSEVDAALAQVVDHVARVHRERFKLHTVVETVP